MLVYHRSHLKEDTIGTIPNGGCRCADQQSHVAVQCLCWEAHQRGVFILHADTGEPERLSRIKIRTPGHRSRSPGFDLRQLQMFCVSLVWGQLNLTVGTIDILSRSTLNIIAEGSEGLILKGAFSRAIFYCNPLLQLCIRHVADNIAVMYRYIAQCIRHVADNIAVMYRYIAQCSRYLLNVAVLVSRVLPVLSTSIGKLLISSTMSMSVSLSDKYFSLPQCCSTRHSLRSSQLLHVIWLNLLAVVLVAVYPTCQGQLEVINQWSFLPFDLPPDFPTGNYIPENNVFTGLEVGWGRVFLTLPRLRSGVAATLATIPRADLQGQTGTSPTLQAYPNWQWHRAEANCSGLISVYRARADRCDRLWVLDSGIMNSLESYTPVCPPKIVAFDLRTDRLVKSYEFPRASLRLNSLLTNLVIDYQGGQSCDDALIYISDTASPGIVVYDARRDVSWRLTHTSMWPSPDHATYEILGLYLDKSSSLVDHALVITRSWVAGESFTLPDGIVGLALSPAPEPSPFNLPQLNKQKVLYFQPLATDRIFSVPTSALKTPPRPDDRENTLPVSLIGYKSSQSAVLAVDPSDGALVFNPLPETALTSWDPSTNHNKLLALDPNLLQFSSDLRFADRDSGNIWLISTRLQKLFRKTYSPKEINMRVMRIRIAPTPYNNSLYLF
uniref:Bee-milk protein n=1 Tax=Timema douglasi TaxID=61478 RepID=A0A7R8VGR0_TIMDO|nr:unnamed protein product [Timema douglasi]